MDLKTEDMTRKTKKVNKSETLAEQIKKVSAGLYYISETDAEIFPFTGDKAEAVSAETILQQIKKDAPVEERDFENFFDRLTKMQEWFGDEEIKSANKYAHLKELLQKNLRAIKVFKIGRIEIDIYIVGLDVENRLMGIRTKAVET